MTGDGEGLVSRGGLVWLGEVADRSGLTAGLGGVLAKVPRRRHDPGITLAQMVVALADGAECLSDLEAFRAQPQLFGPVASRPSAQRAFDALGPAELRRLAGVRRDARAAAWAAGAGPDGEAATIDLDATIVRTRADKEDAAPTHKRTYGHHPHLAMLAETGEVLAGMFRAGNAGANCAADHVVVLAAAIDQLPAEWQAGHLAGDGPALATKSLVVRTDSAGASHWFAEECRARNIDFTLGYWIDGRVRDALLLVQEEDWEPAREPGGRIRDGAQVVEITDLVNLDAWPTGTRLIVRRERPHPGAQLSLFDTIEGFRHTAFITDTTGDDLAALDLRHRRRGRAEQIIRDTKACGLARFPFDGAANNDRWMQLTFTANDLLCWARRISLTGPMRRATPKTIRHRLLHVAAYASPRRLRLDATWPWTGDLLERAAALAAERGIIIADTKFELGMIDGRLALCDEVLTPDSSRFWPADEYKPASTPPSFDKQPLRNHLETLDWDKTPPPPALPAEVIAASRDRYVTAYERITGLRFNDWPGVSGGA